MTQHLLIRRQDALPKAGGARCPAAPLNKSSASAARRGLRALPAVVSAGPGAGSRFAFTLVELLTVISIIAVLAAIGVGMSGAANRKMKEAALQTERDKLVTALESYRADFNQYPPDNLKDRPSDASYTPAINPLVYELLGTFSFNQGSAYRLVDGERLIASTEVQAAFGPSGAPGSAGFLNAVAGVRGTGGPKPKTYLRNVTERQRRTVALPGAPAVELLVAPVDWPLRLSTSAPLYGKVAGTASASVLALNPWRYVSTKPTNNPASYDLWVEAVIGKTLTNLTPTLRTNIDRRVIIGNWRS